MSSFRYNNVYIKDYTTLVGPDEKISKLKGFDASINDFYFGEKTFELAEIKMQRKVIDSLLSRNKLLESNIDLLLGGDLINQLCITNTTASNYYIPYLGLYSACATFNESLIVGANFIESKLVNNALTVISSHNKTAERQYRYPIEYGANKKLYSSYTATGSVASLLTNTETNIKVESGTIGRVIDFGVVDANNMGAIMAPSAADTLFNHLNDLKRNISYYDVILTGDLGEYGSILFKEVCKKKYNLKVNNYLDTASNIYKEEQEVNAGGSGPVCLPLYLFTKVLKEKKYKKILLIATGSLHSTVMVNQKNTLVAVSHAVSLEVK